MNAIAALFVETDGVYFNVPGVDPWDESRDARKYSGSHPVVAHPPCQRWGRYWHGAPNNPHQFRLGEDQGCFATALTAVRNYGGVIEHPAHSHAWRFFGIAAPVAGGGWIAADTFGGMTCYVEQGRYGHPMRKATWLYAYGVELPALRWGRRLDSERGEFKWGSRLYKPEQDRDRPRVDSQHSETPEAFRDVLLAMARSAMSGGARR